MEKAKITPLKKIVVILCFIFIILPVMIVVTAIVFIPFTGWYLLTGQDVMMPWLGCFDVIDNDPYLK